MIRIDISAADDGDMKLELIDGVTPREIRLKILHSDRSGSEIAVSKSELNSALRALE